MVCGYDKPLSPFDAHECHDSVTGHVVSARNDFMRRNSAYGSATHSSGNVAVNGAFSRSMGFDRRALHHDRKRSRRAVLVCVTIATGAMVESRSVSAQTSQPPDTAPPNVITATVTGLRNNTGYVRMSLYDGPGRWPRAGGGMMVCRQPIANRQATCTFSNVRPGQVYAIAIAHDENDNGHVDTNFIGIPTEGYGFSNNARPVLSAPSFNACRFTFTGGNHVIRMVGQY